MGSLQSPLRKAIKLILHMLQCYSTTTVGVGFFHSYTQGETLCATTAFLPNESLVLSHWMPHTFPSLATVAVSEDGALCLSNHSDDEDCIFHAGHHFWPKFSVTGQRPISISWRYWHGLISIPFRMFAQSFIALLTVTKLVMSDFLALLYTRLCQEDCWDWPKVPVHCCHLSHGRDKPKVEDIMISLCIIVYQHCHFWSSSMILRWPHWFVDFQQSSSLHEFLGSKGPLKGIPLPGLRLLEQRELLNMAVFHGQTAKSLHYTHVESRKNWVQGSGLCSPMLFLLTWWFTAEAFAGFNGENHKLPKSSNR